MVAMMVLFAEGNSIRQKLGDLFIPNFMKVCQLIQEF